jgi:hypothetical protein
MKLIRKDIIINIKSKLYKFGTIAIDKAKIEMFYHFPWGSTFKAEQVINDNLERSHLPDHISFHTDGTIHFKYKDENKKTNYYKDQKLDKNPFNLERNNAHILLVESIKSLSALRLKQIDTYKQDSLIFNLGDNSKFSFLLIDMCEKFNPKNLIEGEWSKLKIIDALVWNSVYTQIDKKVLKEPLLSEFDTCLCFLFIENQLPEAQKVVHESTGELGVEQLSLTLTPPPQEIVSLLS